MKRKITVITIAFFLIAMISYTLYTSYIDTKKPYSRVVKVAGDNNFPPYEFKEENNLYTGFNVDIMNAIALREGFIIEFYPMAWNDAVESLKAGKVDVIQGMKITPDREKVFEFSNEYLENSQSIFVRTETEGIEKFEDLAGKRVVIQTGDSITDRLKQIKDIKIIYSENQLEALQKLSNKEVDAFVGNTLAASFQLQRSGLINKIKFTGSIINPTKYSVAAKKGDKETLTLINDGLRKIKINGTYDRIYRKWFGQPVDKSMMYLRTFFYFTIILVAFLLFWDFFFYKWNSTLKKEVEKKTIEINNTNEILKQKNERIREELELRGVVLNRIFSSVIVLNEKGTIIYTNNLVSKTFGDCNLNGKNFRDTIIGSIIEEDMLPNSKGEKIAYLGERKLYIEYIVSTIMTPGEENSHQVMLVLRDKTQEKLLQETIRAKDKVESLGNIMAGIAHEIRNPLTAIKMYVDLIPYKQGNNKFMETCTKDLTLEVERINGLITDLIEFTKPRNSCREKINLKRQVQGILTFLRNTLKSKDVEVIIDIDDDLEILFDKNHFRQVVLNLLMNAMDALDKNEKHIKISAYSEEDIIRLVFEDNGCGIKEEDLTRLFDPFFTTKSSGTGLGLFVSYSFIIENGGEIEISSTLMEGTRVILNLVKVGGKLDEKAVDN